MFKMSDTSVDKRLNQYSVLFKFLSCISIVLDYFFWIGYLMLVSNSLLSFLDLFIYLFYEYFTFRARF